MNAIATTEVPAANEPAALLDVKAVAWMMGCSARQVFRLSDSGRMPAAVRLGGMVRWPRSVIEQWIADGCRPCRSVGRASR